MIGRVLKSEGSQTGDRLRVLVAETNASDLFWLEMVFKSSRLPYSIEVVADADAATSSLEKRGHELDLILDGFGIQEQEHTAYFVLGNKISDQDDPARYIEKPFTRQKLIDCLYEAELDAWADRMGGRELNAA
ncbi:MAG: hypothetical protein ABIR70_06165 [Bryobacteraceae bacterium]